MSAHPHPGSGASQQSFLTLVADDLTGRLPEIVREMRDHLADNIGELNADPQLVEMLQASIEGNVSTICHILANDIALENLQPTTAAVEYAARLAQRGVPISALSRAYYLGQSMFLRLGIDVVEGLPVDEGDRIRLVRAVAETVHRYIDWILIYVSQVYETERQRWWSGRASAHASAIMKVLRGDDEGQALFADAAYVVDQVHHAAIVWSEGPASELAQQHIDRVLSHLAARMSSARPPLMMATDPKTAWVWIGGLNSWPARAEIDTILASAPSVRFALGEAGAGATGFRLSHEQARSAQAIALTSPQHRNARIVSYTDPGISLLSLFAGIRSTRPWVVRTLGQFAEDNEQSASMRQTLAAYFASGENVTRTAEQLHLHRNTVRHRIQLFEDSEVGATDPIEIALAIRLYDAFPDSDPGPRTRT